MKKTTVLYLLKIFFIKIIYRMKINVESNPAITNFALEQNQFLANRYPERISFEYDGIVYRNFETAYQSQKMEKKANRRKGAGMYPEKAKVFARGRMLRKNWENPLAENAGVRVNCANV